MTEITKSTGTPPENTRADSPIQHSGKKDEESFEIVDIPSKDFNKNAVTATANMTSTPIPCSCPVIAPEVTTSPIDDISTFAAEDIIMAEGDLTIAITEEETLDESSTISQKDDSDIKSDVKDESEDKVKKRNYSPVRAPTPSDKRSSPRITRRDDIVKKRLIVGETKAAVEIGAKTTPPKKVITHAGAVKPVSQLGSKMSVPSKVISLASVKRRVVQEPVVPEKKKIILKRRANSEMDEERKSMGMKKSEKSPKEDDAPPKKKYKLITWP